MHPIQDSRPSQFWSRWLKTMMLPDRQPEFQQQFFISQSERLSGLLNSVVAEANMTTDPDACVDYLQLTEILVDLLEKSQLYSVLSPDQIEKRVQEVRLFSEKIQTVQEAVMDWDVRTSTGLKAASRKRARPGDLDEETMGALKRARSSAVEQEMVADAAMNWQYTDAATSIETSLSPWWTQPLYD